MATVAALEATPLCRPRTALGSLAPSDHKHAETSSRHPVEDSQKPCKQSILCARRPLHDCFHEGSTSASLTRQHEDVWLSPPAAAQDSAASAARWM